MVAVNYQSSPPAKSLADRVLECLSAGPMRARDVATRLGAERHDVNSVLYGDLKGQVRQLPGYKWTLAGGTQPTQVPAAVTAGPLSGLCAYYLDCLAEGDGGEVSVWAASKFGHLDYAELSLMPAAGQLDSVLQDTQARALVGRCASPKNRLALRLGAPVLVSERTGKNGAPFRKVEPLLLWSLDAKDAAAGLRSVGTELPSLNLAALKSLSGTQQEALQLVLALTQDLGLAESAENAPEPDEVLLRLREVQADWPWAEPTDPQLSAQGTELASCQGTNIYNRAVLVATEEVPYTKGLREELDRLRSVPGIDGSALGAWLREDDGPTQAAPSGPLLEVFPLNSEQRAAVESALHRPLTVITGPPGTGKSQVVASILVNATQRGLRVLFASKNHQAVDVVERRVNDLSDYPALLRLGAGSDQASRLRQYVSRLLSATAGPEEKSAEEGARQRLDIIHGELGELEARMATTLEARNAADVAEQQAEAARAILSREAFSQSGEIDLPTARGLVTRARQALAAADRSQQGFFARLFWLFIRGGRREALRAAVEALVSRPIRKSHQLADLWSWGEIPNRHAVSLDAADLVRLGEQLATLDQRVQLAGLAAAYFDALDDLRQSDALEGCVRRKADLSDALCAASLEFWRAWLALRPASLTKGQRKLLADYGTVLDLLSRANEDSGVEASTWRQYYSLSAACVEFLPCWAVTSLSARGRVPFSPGLFDLLVIDEASQCDIASALPLLYRAKRAVIIGDPMQLRHITPLASGRDRQLLEKHDLVDSHLAWSYSSNSLFDLAQGLIGGEDLVMLRDHHRSHPDIIGYSNAEFYGGKLRVATRLDVLRRLPGDAPAVTWKHVEGHSRRPAGGGLVNDEEAEAVVAELRDLILRRGYRGSIGVTSPFRAQVNRIKDIANQDPQLSAVLDSLDFVVDSVHRFQGDERDLIVFSPAVSKGDTKRALGFLGSQPNIFNVAITRARGALIVVGDRVATEESGIPFFSRFARYVKGLEVKRAEAPSLGSDVGPAYPPVLNPHQVSEWEKVLYRALYAAGIRPLPQYTEEKYILDFAVISGSRKLAIEVDGEMYHRAWDGELLRRDQIRTMRLIELGWDVMRFWVYEVRDDLPRCVAKVTKWLGSGDPPSTTCMS